ncbi:sensor histidine kinase [Pseudomonas sp. LTJR-52]|uniref:sensor histidine kinase n=1 Tax=Pseudomonas sp. LTJR-52 TaxID=2479392 RepID=UPI000EFA5AF2|nr:sensor histidine kinase [Pseudomonas sp. LTJR-52]AYN96187.1 sensor histidine kinase [Pseudomonas sp. LTJR-52]
MIRLPYRHSLFWKLSGLTIAACLVIVWLSLSWGRSMEHSHYELAQADKEELLNYAASVEQAWRTQGKEGVETALRRIREGEQVWAVAIDRLYQPLGQRALTPGDADRFSFMRRLDWPLSGRATELPVMDIPFPQHPEAGRLAMELPERMWSGKPSVLGRLVIHGLFPMATMFLLCILLYRQLMVPLRWLQEQASSACRSGRKPKIGVSARSDELGELGRAFDHMAERLEGHVEYQQRLLRDMSHELRTPLSRLRVLCESSEDANTLRARLERELAGMQELVETTLELAWLDTDRPSLLCEPISMQSLWNILIEDACFETGWSRDAFVYRLPDNCYVQAHLNSLARALENLLRNAIRHSPEGGYVILGGHCEGSEWLLWIQDQGPGVAEGALHYIFEPFTRLNGARPGGDGFGLGLSIARSALMIQGGAIWAENCNPGLRVTVRLPAAGIV